MYLKVEKVDKNEEFKTCSSTHAQQLISVSAETDAYTLRISYVETGVSVTSADSSTYSSGTGFLLKIAQYDSGSSDNQDMSEIASTCTNSNTKWKEFIYEGPISGVSTETACKTKCVSAETCQFAAFAGTNCYFGKFNLTSPITFTETNNPKIHINQGLINGLTTKPTETQFETNSQFNCLTPFYHKTTAIQVSTESDCAARCQISCVGSSLCQYYHYDSGSKFCTLGNFKNTGSPSPLELDVDELPLSTMKIRKSSPAIIGN